MKFDYHKKLGRGLVVASLVGLSSLSLVIYHGQAIAGGQSEGHGGGSSNSQGADRSAAKAGNASLTGKLHAAHDSAVYLADPDGHNADGHGH